MVETREGSLFPFGKWRAILWSPIRRNYRGQRDKPSSNPTFSIIRLIPVGCADGKARTLKRSESNYSIWVGVYRSPGDWTRDEDSPSWLLVLSTRMEQRITIMNCNIRLDADPELYSARLRWYSCPYSTVITISKRLNVAATDSTRETRGCLASPIFLFFSLSPPPFFLLLSFFLAILPLTRLPFGAAQSSTDFKAIFRGDRRYSSIKYSRFVVSRKVTPLARGFRECIVPFEKDLFT